jgi:selenocysteine-specific translation elongation factor
LLVVAADDSVMPQTREHLEILKLLGLRHGLIAVTKSDLVDETTREVVALEVRSLVADSFLADSPIIFCTRPALSPAPKARNRHSRPQRSSRRWSNASGRK